MGSYDDYSPEHARQRDFVLASNEFCFLQNKTNGIIKTYTGPITMTISAQESLMVFNERTKQFEVTNDFEEGKQLFVSAPENWYIVLKNPTKGREYPEVGKAAVSPQLEIGKKINIAGPCSFSLFPGQMAKTVKGHTLRSNQYLLARVYDPEAASTAKATVIDANTGEAMEAKTEKYFAGQILVIKGTEVSFYIPPTGIEVIAIDNDPRQGYIRDAVTLERLEYAILKDENGTKKYVHGPAVVFPEPTETFVTAPKGGNIFRAIELSKISGVYIKVIAEYTEDGKTHPVGEELFITGNDQMIYYPRPEHAIISYDGKVMHHAIAIPKGEGRYIMNRLTGEITTKVGPAMYLPDPRTEVVIKRKLTPSQCKLWYPGNTEVLEYNDALTEKGVEKAVLKGLSNDAKFCNSITTSASLNSAYTAVNIDSFETNASISRGTSYTKPRTVMLDTKYDGVVSMDIWTGYAVNVISKNGDRKVACGPQTILLDYDQTLDILQLSTGRPKTTDRMIQTVFLKYENNKVSDIINVETKDFVDVNIKVSYCVDFLPEYQDKWFAIDNYVKYMCDRQRSLLKREAKKYTIEEFYQNYADITRKIVLDTNDKKVNEGEKPAKRAGRFFPENGMLVHDVEVLSVHMDAEIEELLENKRYDTIKKSFELANAEKDLEIIEKLAQTEKRKQEIAHDKLTAKLNLQKEEAEQQLKIDAAIAAQKREEEVAKTSARKDMQPILDAINTAEIKRNQEAKDADIAYKQALADIEAAKQKAYADTVASIMASISEDLVAAMNTKSNAEMTKAIAESLSPYALAEGSESAADVANKLLRGLPIENIIKTAEVSAKM